MQIKPLIIPPSLPFFTIYSKSLLILSFFRFSALHTITPPYSTNVSDHWFRAVSTILRRIYAYSLSSSLVNFLIMIDLLIVHMPIRSHFHRPLQCAWRTKATVGIEIQFSLTLPLCVSLSSLPISICSQISSVWWYPREPTLLQCKIKCNTKLSNRWPTLIFCNVSNNVKLIYSNFWLLWFLS